MEFGPDYQKELVGRFCSVEFVQDVGHLLREDMFDPEFQPVIERALNMWEKGRKVMTKAQLLHVCQTSGIKGVRPRKTGFSDFDREEVLLYSRNRLFREALAEVATLGSKGKFLAGLQRMENCILNFPKAQHPEALDILQRNRPPPIRRNIIPTGLPSLDTSLRGGPAAGDLAVVLAPTSGGKTSLLCSFAATAVRAGGKVFYVTLEVPAEEIEYKLRAHLAKAEKPCKHKWEQIAKKLRKNHSRLQVQEYQPYSVTPLELDREIPTDTTLIVIDYADYLQPPRGSMGKEYNDLGDIYSRIKAMGLKRRIPVWTASQVNRMAYGGDPLRVQHVESSLRKMMVCDVSLAIEQTEEQATVDERTGHCEAELVLVKNRPGQRYGRVEVTVDWATCQFWEGQWA